MYKSPWYFQWTLSQLPFWFRRNSSKQIFKMDTMAAILDFLLQQFELFFIYKSPRCFLPSLESIGLSVQKKEGKIDFQDGHHLGFPIGTVLAIFISTSYPDASYQFSNQLALWFRKISEKKKSFKMATMGWSGVAMVSCILRHRGVQLKLAYSWARPAILVAGKGRGGMFLFLLFLHFHSCSYFFPNRLFHLLYYLFYLFSPFLWETTQNDPQGLTCR